MNYILSKLTNGDFKIQSSDSNLSYNFYYPNSKDLLESPVIVDGEDLDSPFWEMSRIDGVWKKVPRKWVEKTKLLSSRQSISFKYPELMTLQWQVLLDDEQWVECDKSFLKDAKILFDRGSKKFRCVFVRKEKEIEKRVERAPYPKPIIDNILGIHNAWPLVDVLRKLKESTEYLLNVKDYDREVINNILYTLCCKFM